MNKISDEDLKLINQYTRRELTENEIYTFKIVLCDNQADRDCEKFSIESLKNLSKLFLGKAGIFDTSNVITSRIYKTYIVTDYNKVECGEPYTYLGAEAYVIKSDKSESLINELESGYKKEVSIGCSVSTLRCSICNQNVKRSQCVHVKGNTYNGAKCYYFLEEPTDAYEWAFVKSPKETKQKQTLKYVQDYFDNGKKQEFCKLIKENLIEGWEKYTGQKFEPTITLSKVKRGRMLTASYEAIKEQKVDIYMVVIQQLGRDIAKSLDGYFEYGDFIIENDLICLKEFEKAKVFVYMS